MPSQCRSTSLWACRGDGLWESKLGGRRLANRIGEAISSEEIATHMTPMTLVADDLRTRGSPTLLQGLGACEGASLHSRARLDVTLARQVFRSMCS